MIGLIIAVILGWYGRWTWLWLPLLAELAYPFAFGLVDGVPDPSLFLMGLGIALVLIAIGYVIGFGLHRLIKGPRSSHSISDGHPQAAIRWLFVILGIVVLIIPFLWMVIIVQAGWSDAWWWFEWQDFKFIMLPFFIAAGVLIGFGVKDRFINKNLPIG